MLRIFRHGWLLFLVVALAGCIEVKDVGAYWDTAGADPALEGKWQLHSLTEEPDSAGLILILQKQDGQYSVTTIEDGVEKNEGVLRTFDFEGRSFALIKNPDTQAATLWPYKIENETLQAFAAPESLESPVIDMLNELSLESLIKIMDGPPAWQATISGKKAE